MTTRSESLTSRSKITSNGVALPQLRRFDGDNIALPVRADASEDVFIHGRRLSAEADDVRNAVGVLDEAGGTDEIEARENVVGEQRSGDPSPHATNRSLALQFRKERLHALAREGALGNSLLPGFRMDCVPVHAEAEE
jgi:hypothetical protein